MEDNIDATFTLGGIQAKSDRGWTIATLPRKTRYLH